MDYNIIKGKSILTNVIDAYSGNLNYIISEYTDNGIYLCKIPATNTTTLPTLNINSIGAKDVVSVDGTSLNIGSMLINGWYNFMYSLSADKFYLMSYMGSFVQNTVYVMKNGSDTTGLVERFDKPFLTIEAATNAAVAYFTSRDVDNRVKIIVESGTYTEDINLQKFIDYDLGNSVINGCVTDNNVDFGVIQNEEWHCIIYGQSIISKTTSFGSYNQGFILFKSNNNILVNCATISSSINDAVAMIGGYAKIFCDNIISRDSVSTSRNAINMAVDSSENRCILEVVGANIETLQGGKSPSIDYAGTVTQTLKLINCYVKTKINNLGSSSAITSGRTSASVSGILYLYNTTIFSQNGNSIEVLNLFGNCDLTVYSIHSNIANTSTVANGTSTLTVLINTITINALLPY